MFAVVRTGGKQYRVTPGDLLSLEKLAGDAGDSITFDEVLMAGDGESVSVGTPLLEGAGVSAEVVNQYRTRKILVFRKRRRKNSRRMNGHRQHQTLVRITAITALGTTAEYEPPVDEEPEVEVVEVEENSESTSEATESKE